MSDVNTYVMAAAATIDCHECTCHLSPPCSGCVDCKVCNPCSGCEEVHDGPRDDQCQRDPKADR